MKIRLSTYVHKENGISLQLLPETAIEERLLDGLFRHGRMKTGHPSDANGDTGYFISWQYG